MFGVFERAKVPNKHDLAQALIMSVLTPEYHNSANLKFRLFSLYWNIFGRKYLFVVYSLLFQTWEQFACVVGGRYPDPVLVLADGTENGW